MNYASQPLQRHEIRFMRAEPTIIQRVLQSYRLMLDFYGMRLVSADTGLIERVLPPRNSAARYQNLLRESPMHAMTSLCIRIQISLPGDAQDPPTTISESREFSNVYRSSVSSG